MTTKIVSLTCIDGETIADHVTKKLGLKTSWRFEREAMCMGDETERLDIEWHTGDQARQILQLLEDLWGGSEAEHLAQFEILGLEDLLAAA